MLACCLGSAVHGWQHIPREDEQHLQCIRGAPGVASLQSKDVHSLYNLYTSHGCSIPVQPKNVQTHGQPKDVRPLHNIRMFNPCTTQGCSTPGEPKDVNPCTTQGCSTPA